MKILQEYLIVCIKTNVHFFIKFRSVLLRMRNVSDKLVEKVKTHISCPITFLRKSCRLWDHVEECSRVSQATNNNMAHARCMLDN